MKFEIEIPEGMASDLKRVLVELLKQAVREMKDSPVDPFGNNRLRYSHQEAAEMLGLNEQQLHGERRRGRIKAYRGIKNRFFYLPEDLQEYVRSDQTEERYSPWGRR